MSKEELIKEEKRKVIKRGNEKGGAIKNSIWMIIH